MSEEESPRKVNWLGLAFVFSPVLLMAGCAAMLVFPWKSVAPPAPQVQSFEVTPALTPAGEEWPLTVEKAALVCGSANRLMLAVPDTTGTWYWLNGLAKQTHRYADLDQIWRDDPNIEGAKVTMWLTDYGLEKCQGR